MKARSGAGAAAAAAAAARPCSAAASAWWSRSRGKWKGKNSFLMQNWSLRKKPPAPAWPARREKAKAVRRKCWSVVRARQLRQTKRARGTCRGGSRARMPATRSSGRSEKRALLGIGSPPPPAAGRRTISTL
uniref:Uncharacterized protein n=1 Tax=Arundo donax TaxID=35708 RepID=A0A0A9FY18_ARUDO